LNENEGDETVRKSKEWEGKSMQIGGNAVVSLCWLITGPCPIFWLKARCRTDDFLCVLQLHPVKIFLAHSQREHPHTHTQTHSQTQLQAWCVAIV